MASSSLSHLRHTVGPPMPRPLGSVLVPLARSASAEQVIARVASLPLAAGARLVLLHVVPGLRGLGVTRRIERDARVLLSAAASELSRRLSRSADVSARIAAGLATSRIAEEARSMKAELIVMGPHAHPIRELAIGTTAVRVVREAGLPVLVARLSAVGRYRRPLLALDLDDTALQVLELTSRVLPVPRPPVALIHAYEAPFRALVYPSPSAEAASEYREHCRRQANRRLEELLAAASTRLAPGDEIHWMPHLQYGAPRAVIPSTAAELGCDLLALGTHARSGVARTLIGSVAADVLRSVTCDVLLVPARGEPAGRR
jgi:nucleotide-binding universal stress UspA family protein